MFVHNRKARFEYYIDKEFTAGMVLEGSEIKSLRSSNANISDAFIYISNGEIFIKGMYIAKYPHATHSNHEELRDRKLLLKSKEIREIAKWLQTPGHTCVPLYTTSKNGYAKLLIGTAVGKKLYNKKEAARERDIKIQTQRELGYGN
jgi:SsrA-binding protein